MQTVLAINSLPVILTKFLVGIEMAVLLMVFAFWIGMLTILDDEGHPFIAFILLVLTFVIPYALFC
jgi:hypothetical protein